MYKKWLIEDCNIRLKDYKKLTEEEKWNLYLEWISSVTKQVKCPCCGNDMVCGYPVWDGRMSHVDYTMALVALPAKGGMFGAEQQELVPMPYMCTECGFTGLFATKRDMQRFKEACCNIDYHYQ